MTTVYIIRHGETDSNLRYACVGHKDVPLNETGLYQAQQLAKRLSGVKFDAVYTSPLGRTVQTIAPTVKNDIQLTLSYSFIERDYGIWDDMTFAEIKERYPNEYRMWQIDFTGYKIPDGESSAEVQQRVNEAIKKLLKEHKDETIAIVTHLGTARHIISCLLGLSLDESWRFTFENAKYAVIGIENDIPGILMGLNL